MHASLFELQWCCVFLPRSQEKCIGVGVGGGGDLLVPLALPPALLSFLAPFLQDKTQKKRGSLLPLFPLPPSPPLPDQRGTHSHTDAAKAGISPPPSSSIPHYYSILSQCDGKEKWVGGGGGGGRESQLGGRGFRQSKGGFFGKRTRRRRRRRRRMGRS